MHIWDWGASTNIVYGRELLIPFSWLTYISNLYYLVQEYTNSPSFVYF